MEEAYFNAFNSSSDSLFETDQNKLEQVRENTRSNGNLDVLGLYMEE